MGRFRWAGLALAVSLTPALFAQEKGPVWQLYAGGEFNDAALAVAIDGERNVFLGGHSFSPDWIHGGWSTEASGNMDGFLAKRSPDGGHVWSTYVGGGGSDRVEAVAVDADGNSYAVGDTTEPGWAEGGWDTSDSFSNAFKKGFVVKTGPHGEHLWSSYLGADLPQVGSIARTRATAVDVNAAGEVLVAGYTNGGNWIPNVPPAVDFRGWRCGFVLLFDADGALLWGRYVGGQFGDSILAAAFDPEGNIIVGGDTTSSPQVSNPSGTWISGGWSTEYSGWGDGFVMKLDPQGQHLWSTYVGGGAPEQFRHLAVGADGSIVAVGSTFEGGWVEGGWLTPEETNVGGFAVKFAADGTHLWSTYLGGEADDGASAVATDTDGNVFVAGHTRSPAWLGGQWGSVQLQADGAPAYVVMLAADGEHVWSNYYPWRGIFRITGMVIDGEANAYVTGLAYPEEWFPEGDPGPHGGDGDAFLAKIGDVVGPDSWLIF